MCPYRPSIDLVPAENRGYRELFLTSQLAIRRLRKLADAFDGHGAETVLRNAAGALETTLDEIRPALAAHDLFTGPAAEGNGARMGTVRAAVVDRFLERNQALRFAVDDVDREATLLAYLANVSETRNDPELPVLCRTAERRLRRHVSAIRKAAAELGSDPAYAIEPLDPSRAGRSAHKVGWVVGSVGEWTDRLVSKRRRN